MLSMDLDPKVGKIHHTLRKMSAPATKRKSRLSLQTSSSFKRPDTRSDDARAATAGSAACHPNQEPCAPHATAPHAAGPQHANIVASVDHASCPGLLAPEADARVGGHARIVACGGASAQEAPVRQHEVGASVRLVGSTASPAAGQQPQLGPPAWEQPTKHHAGLSYHGIGQDMHFAGCDAEVAGPSASSAVFAAGDACSGVVAEGAPLPPAALTAGGDALMHEEDDWDGSVAATGGAGGGDEGCCGLSDGADEDIGDGGVEGTAWGALEGAEWGEGAECEMQVVKRDDGGQSAAPWEEERKDGDEGLLMRGGRDNAGQCGSPANSADQAGGGDNSTGFGVATWLSALGLYHHLPLFEAAEVDEEALPHLRDKDLQDMGISSSHDRAALLAAVAAAAAAGRAETRAAAQSPFSAAAGGNGGGDEGEGDDDVMLVECRPGAGGAAPPPAVEVTLLESPQQGGQRQRGPRHQQQQGRQQQQAPPAAPTVAPYSGLFNSKPADPCRAKITAFFRPDASLQPSSSGGGGSGRAGQQQQQQWQGREQQQHQVQDQQQQAARDRQPGGPRGSRAQAPAPACPAPVPSGSGRQVPLQQQGPGQQGPPPHVGSASGLSRRVPRWHTIPGTRFLVDLFSPWSRDIEGCNFWFLTHFHADHYKGLSRHFNQGTIVCGPVTAQLISTKLKIPWDRILVVPLDTPTLVEGTTITLIDANHCPGAAMIVAETPGRAPVLHTGDARLVPEMQSHPALQQLVGRAICVLDTTYCDPQYTFPSQQDTLKFTLNAVASEKFNPRTLFVFGSYTIGKERLFLEVARAHGRKVYVCKDKMQTLQCCNLAPEYASLLTTDHLATNIHAVPLFKVNVQGLTEILAQTKGRYNSIVGFAPTGWTHQKLQQQGGGKASCGRKVQRGKSSVALYQVPYSEHSSFHELHAFVAWLKPIEILPSVGNDRGPKVKKMRELLTQPLPCDKQRTILTMFKAKATA